MNVEEIYLRQIDQKLKLQIQIQENNKLLKSILKNYQNKISSKLI